MAKKNNGLLIAGGAALVALGFAVVANAQGKTTKTNPKKRSDGTRKDMPAKDASKDDFDPVLSDPDLLKEWNASKEVAPPKKDEAPSLQRVDPPNFGAPDATYDAEIFQEPSDIREFFAAFGYLPVSQINNEPMNDLGPDRKLGGGDDVPSEAVAEFQEDYNLVVASNDQGQIWGTLDEDGLVGPHTLNALQQARSQAVGIEADGLSAWWGDLVAQAAEPLPASPASTPTPDNSPLPDVTDS